MHQFSRNLNETIIAKNRTISFLIFKEFSEFLLGNILKKDYFFFPFAGAFVAFAASCAAFIAAP